jgi:hypothetical protein
VTPVDFRDPERFAHGTRSRYNAGKCRCAACRAANSVYEKQRQRSNQPNPLVSSHAAREHLLELARAGIGLRSVSDASDVPRSILHGIRRGTRPNLRQVTERRILAVDTGAIADHGFVPARETHRLLRDLIEEGYPRYRIAEKLGSTARIPTLQFKTTRVLAKSALRVRKLHAELVGGDEDRTPVFQPDTSKRGQILRAIRHYDWVGTEDLLEAMGVERTEKNTYNQVLIRLVKTGEVERSSIRSDTGGYLHRLARAQKQAA